jgi:hypothetical protein
MNAILKVCRWSTGCPDRYSFEHPPVLSETDWEKLLTKTWTDAESLIQQIEQLPDQKLWEDFSDKKYGN